MNRMILAGDIGGTRARLALFEPGAATACFVRTLPSRDHADFATLLAAFLDLAGQRRGAQGRTIEAAAFGVAGPVDGEGAEARVRATNLPWTLFAAAIGEQLGGCPVRLVNDLIAVGLGALASPVDTRVNLNPEAAIGDAHSHAQGHAAVIAPGTGLGEALFFHDGSRHHPMPSEGGHCDFAPNDERETALLAYLRGRFGGHVSYERILSGDGFSSLYAFARHAQLGRCATDADEQLAAAADPNARITAWARDGSDECAVIACRLFARILGAEAGNIALKALPTGGVFIAGGLVGHVLPFLREHTLEGFLDKGRFATMLGRLPLWVVADGELGITGARRLAEQQINHTRDER
ncbi:glucokinase [Guyparkeria hydrothermalis]|uniref:glucokinase n=1 Tax=Guyparkeria hydrothermalis TaxID=923 RepID=UPI0020216917|nr:glucokinase [Guyparkeria hydrothermalis]MCL7750051.1 glucokinase [Guyparkeria hydrothermalis]